MVALAVPKLESTSYLNSISQFDHPLQILELLGKREPVFMALNKILTEKPQLDLFNSEKLEDVLREIEGLVVRDRPIYKRWKQKDAKGKERDLAVPKEPLKKFFQFYLKPFLLEIPNHPCSHGGEIISKRAAGFSPHTSLRFHVPIGSVLSFDLSSAYKAVTIEDVFDLYNNNLEDKVNDPNLRTNVGGLLAALSTVFYPDTNTRALPQGSPISSLLFNRALYSLDEQLSNYSKEHGLTFTRWIDDFTLSSRDSNLSAEIFYTVLGIVSKNYPLAEHKVYLQRKPPYFLLGHKIRGSGIAKVEYADDYKIGEPVKKELYQEFLSLNQ